MKTYYSIARSKFLDISSMNTSHLLSALCVIERDEHSEHAPQGVCAANIRHELLMRVTGQQTDGFTFDELERLRKKALQQIKRKGFVAADSLRELLHGSNESPVNTRIFSHVFRDRRFKKMPNSVSNDTDG